MDINQDLLAQTILHHGEDLKTILRESKAPVDWSQINSLNSIPKPLNLMNFIADNSEGLFLPFPSPNNDIEIIKSSILSPLENFMDVSEEDRRSHFFKDLENSDTLICRVSSIGVEQITLTVMSYHPSLSIKSRKLHDLKIRILCTHFSHYHYDVGKLVSFHVSSIENEKIIGSILESYDEDNYFLSANDNCFKDYLENSGLLTSFDVDHLIRDLGLSSKSSSLLFPHKNSIGNSAKELREAQSQKWAFKHVTSGIEYFKNGNNIEAFQCLNQALSIHSENIEGLVARGALYANNGSFAKAINDFEKALALDPSHKNALKYIVDTLVASFKIKESEELYQKLLLYDPNNEEIKVFRKSRRKFKCDSEERFSNEFSRHSKERKKEESRKRKSCSLLDSLQDLNDEIEGHFKEVEKSKNKNPIRRFSDVSSSSTDRSRSQEFKRSSETQHHHHGIKEYKKVESNQVNDNGIPSSSKSLIITNYDVPKPESIIPGTLSLEDLDAYVNEKRRKKVDTIKQAFSFKKR